MRNLPERVESPQITSVRGHFSQPAIVFFGCH
jgi:hypothetical protein